MKENKKRRLKVYGQSNGYNYENVPAIILKGKWLASAGFQIGNDVDIVVEEGKLLIQNTSKTLVEKN